MGTGGGTMGGWTVMCRVTGDDRGGSLILKPMLENPQIVMRGLVSECEWLDGYGFGILREKNDVGVTMEDSSVEASEVEGGGKVARSVWLQRGWKVMDEGDDGFDDGGIRVSDGGGL
ncbi:hypothetical protein PIB30_093814 [Stylosanthes scabra]|uniref:Uncharacterized protein n=1 Tax=Stylosanthes scabra TaxID=79078 RepID=A0ABU6XVJ2_9FABA|nr:hypothetical protein [Stylosanthes scabra]